MKKIAQNLAMHLAVMRPMYTRIIEVPSEVREKYLEDGGEKNLMKFYDQNVFME